MYFSKSWNEQGSYFHVCKYKWRQAQWRVFVLWQTLHRKSFLSIWIWKTPSPQTFMGWFQQLDYHIAMSPTRPAFCAHISLFPLCKRLFSLLELKHYKNSSFFYLKGSRHPSINRREGRNKDEKEKEKLFKWQNNAIIFWIILICCVAMFVLQLRKRMSILNAALNWTLRPNLSSSHRLFFLNMTVTV